MPEPNFTFDWNGYRKAFDDVGRASSRASQSFASFADVSNQATEPINVLVTVKNNKQLNLADKKELQELQESYMITFQYLEAKSKIIRGFNGRARKPMIRDCIRSSNHEIALLGSSLRRMKEIKERVQK